MYIKFGKGLCGYCGASSNLVVSIALTSSIIVTYDSSDQPLALAKANGR